MRRRGILAALIGMAALAGCQVPWPSIPPRTTTPTTTTTIGPTPTTGAPTTSVAPSTTLPSTPTAADFVVSRVVGEVQDPSDLQPFPTTDLSGPCRAGLTQVTVGHDVVTCDDGSTLVALAAQNYGLIDMRSTRQFDFADRIGTISFDSDAVTTGILGSWISVFVTDEPVPVASSSVQVLGYMPRNGFGVTFDEQCGAPGKVGVGSVTVYQDTVETTIAGNHQCIATALGVLRHFTIQVSASRITVKGDGLTMFDAPVSLAAPSGYVHFVTAERAPGKYGLTPDHAETHWKNLSFDGPVLEQPTVSRVADNTAVNGRGVNIGWPMGAALTIPAVPAGVTSAVLSAAVQFTFGTDPTLSYRLNGGPVHQVPFDAATQSRCTGCPGPSGGWGVGFAIPVDPAEVHAGANTVTFAGTGQAGSWPYAVSNVSLLTGGGTSTPTTSTTTTTVAPTTTGTAAPSTSTSTTSTTVSPSTSTTTSLPGSTSTTQPSGLAGCGLPAAAFCDTFDAPAAPHPNLNPRTGDLDPVIWGVSRVGQANYGDGQQNRLGLPTMNACGHTGPVDPPGDVRICNGKLYEAVNDDHQVGNLDMYPKQPFDFAGRTGVATFDVSANSEGNHGAWPEWIITDKPVPGTRVDISNAGGTSGNNDVPPPMAVNEFGMTFDGGCLGQQNTTGVSRMFQSANGAFRELDFQATGCIIKGDPDHLNHFEIRISKSRVEVWGTDPGSTVLKQVAVAVNLDLPLTRGLIWINDVHYNADKFPNPTGQRDHMFVWDNVGFDGPKTYRDIGYDVDDNHIRTAPGTVDTGYLVGAGTRTLTIDNQGTTQTPTGAQVVLNYWSTANPPPDLSVNGGPFIVTPSPFRDGAAWLWKTISIPVPLAQLRPGVNTLTFRSSDGLMQVANVSLIQVAGAPVP